MFARLSRCLVLSTFLVCACDEVAEEEETGDAGAHADQTMVYEGGTGCSLSDPELACKYGLVCDPCTFRCVAPGTTCDAGAGADKGNGDTHQASEPDGKAADAAPPADLPAAPDLPAPPDLPPPPDTNPCTSGGLWLSGSAAKTLSKGTYSYPFVCVSGSAKLTTSGSVTINVSDKCSGVYIRGKGLKASGAVTINYPGKKAVVIDVDLTSGGANLTINAPNSTVAIKGTGKGSLYLKLKTKALCVFAPQSSVKISGGIGSRGGCLPTPKSCP